jgi:hypothetical protein
VFLRGFSLAGEKGTHRPVLHKGGNTLEGPKTLGEGGPKGRGGTMFHVKHNRVPDMVGFARRGNFVEIYTEGERNLTTPGLLPTAGGRVVVSGYLSGALSIPRLSLPRPSA